MRDERRLARRAARGDRDAFTAIFRRFQPDLYRYCVAILGNPEDAQDALQNTMVKALGALPGERREIELKPWLYRIAHNESIELIRRRRQCVSLDERELPPGMTLVEEVETRQRLRQLLVDVGELPERQRGALLMREAGGLKFEEIATALGTSPAVARQTVYEARLGLREMDAGRNMECTAVTKALSDGDRRVRRRRDLTAHLKACPECRLFAEEIDSRRHALASISPLPVPVAAALLQGLGGGGAGAGAASGAGAGSTGGVSGAVGAGAGKAIGTTALIKGAATIAAAAAIGVGGADVTGVLHPAPHESGSQVRAGSVGPQSGSAHPRPSALAAFPASADRTAPDQIPADRPSPSHPVGGERRPPGSSPSPASSPSVGAAAMPATSAPRDEPGGPIAGPGGEATTAAQAAKSAAETADAAGHAPRLPPSSAHGQETAAANAESVKPGASSGNSEAAGDGSPPTVPGHPVHPDHPAAPSDSEPTEVPQPGVAATAEPESPAAVEESPPGRSGGAPGQEKRDEP